jgi:hypothetical protein
LGDINWLHPYLKLTTGELKPLFDVLWGDSDPISPRSLTIEAQRSLARVEQAISQQVMGYFDPTEPLFLIFSTTFTPTGLLWQKDSPLFWIHLPAIPSKVLLTFPLLVCQVISLGLKMATHNFGRNSDVIISLYSSKHLAWLQSQFNDWSILLSINQGTFDTHLPSNRLLQFLQVTPFVFPKVTHSDPISESLNVFIVGSKNGKATLVIHGQIQRTDTIYTSAQLVKLCVALKVFELVALPFNLYSDSHYVVRALQVLEVVPSIQTLTATFQMFFKIQMLIRAHAHPFFVGHIRAHSSLPGPLTEGNDLADQANRLTCLASLSDPLTEAKTARALHHINAHTLRLSYKITREQARQIVK